MEMQAPENFKPMKFFGCGGKPCLANPNRVINRNQRREIYGIIGAFTARCDEGKALEDNIRIFNEFCNTRTKEEIKSIEYRMLDSINKLLYVKKINLPEIVINLKDELDKKAGSGTWSAEQAL